MKKQVKGSALKALIQDEIKKLITDNNLRPGDFLSPEGQIADDLGVSRGSVREAIKSLESLGIVESRHGEGVCVRDFNFDATFNFLSYGLIFQPARAQEILQIRAWLESAALSLSIEIMPEATLKEIDALLIGWEKKTQAKQPTTGDDRQFHRLLCSPLGNESLISLIDIFWVVYRSMELRTIPQDSHPEKTIKDHRAIFEAIRQKDSKLAKKLLDQHFFHVQQRIAHVVKDKSRSEDKA